MASKPDRTVPDVEEMKHRTGRQVDDNLDDMGRDVNDKDTEKARHPQKDVGR
ncbi:hypothetical protein SAMN02983003_1268 [Devosia enhydra]|uniref:Uncharacterized protein n=1 Tax=Devosia enhydra TaxID=665118 RepID=A0A1K2HW36_9HYPH|nr:hypothetical protein [Devosia enhydra]SFZ82774.1 hypothetical protein SAMN02983003_1268 [Devosia enhydra]